MNNRSRIFVVGSANMDMVLRVPRFPHAGETLAGSDLNLFPGGKGANQACAAARLGGDVRIVGCVGSDVFGAQLLASLREAGVDISRVRTLSRATGCAPRRHWCNPTSHYSEAELRLGRKVRNRSARSDRS